MLEVLSKLLRLEVLPDLLLLLAPLSSLLEAALLHGLLTYEILMENILKKQEYCLKLFKEFTLGRILLKVNKNSSAGRTIF